MPRANTIQIVINADGTVASKNINGVATSLGALTSPTQDLTSQTNRLAQGFASLYVGKQAFDAITASIRTTLQFMAQIETSSLGIAASFLASGKYIDETTGKALTGQRALSAAQQHTKDVMKELQIANFETIATLDQLVRAYQETLPVAMAKGFDTSQIKEFTLAAVQAAGALGISLDMLAEETRSMLTGAINPRTSRIAVALGITPEDIRAVQGDADRLFAYLMSRLEGFRIAGIASQETWTGLWSNMADTALMTGKHVLEPLFETIKAVLSEIQKKIMLVDDTTGKVKGFNPEFLENIESVRVAIGQIAAGVLISAKEFDIVGTAIGEQFARMAERIKNPIRTIKAVFGKGEEFWPQSAIFDKIERYNNLIDVALGKQKQAQSSANAPPYNPNPPKPDPEAAERAARAAQKLAEDLKRAQAALDDLAFAASLADPSLSDLDKTFLQLDRTAAKFKEQYGTTPELFARVDAEIAKSKGYAALKAQLEQAAKEAELIQKGYAAREEYERELTEKTITEHERRLAAVDKWYTDMRAKAAQFAADQYEFQEEDVRLTRETANAKAVIWNEYYAHLLSKEAELVQERQKIINSLVMDDVTRGTSGMTGQKDMQSLVAMGQGEDPYSQALARLEENYTARMQMAQSFAEFELTLAQWEADEEAVINAQKVQMASATFGMLAGMAMSLYDATGKQSKAAFTAYKAFAIAQTTIDTIKAAVGAYSAMASIPIVGPALGAAAAAAAIAYGMARVAQISSMQPGGSASVPKPSGKKASLPEQEEPKEAETVHTSRTVNVYVYGSLVDHDKFAREIIPAITKAQGDRVA